MSRLRRPQARLKQLVQQKWSEGHKRVMMQAATGFGKTVIIGDVIKDFNVTCSMAHRKELVGQISRALAAENIQHDIVAPKPIVKSIVKTHMDSFGRSYYDPRSDHKVASVDTIIRHAGTDPWFKRVQLCVPDEAHHVTEVNKWGRGVLMMPQARALFPTATPTRADGIGLGAGVGGLADALVEGPPMRWIIDNGYLTDYRVLCPEVADLDLKDVHITASGEFNMDELAQAMRKSQKIISDVVDTYKRYAMGKLGVTFAVNIEEARRLTKAYNDAGIPAALLTGEDDDATRVNVLNKFARRELLQLVNVDLFGEGFDLPAIECVSMARPTASYSLYVQQFGRALRLMIGEYHSKLWDTYSVETRLHIIANSGKPFAWIFDHVGNLLRHKGPPDKPRLWTLEPRRKRGPRIADDIALRICTGCQQAYERIESRCPYCKVAAPEPTERGSPDFVDGDLKLLSADVLAKMRGAVTWLDGPPVVPPHLPHAAQVNLRVNWANRQAAQDGLRKTIAQWAGYYVNDPDDKTQRRFYLTFGVDVLTALALGTEDANNLRERIVNKLALDVKLNNVYDWAAYQ